MVSLTEQKVGAVSDGFERKHFTKKQNKTQTQNANLPSAVSPRTSLRAAGVVRAVPTGIRSARLASSRARFGVGTQCHRPVVCARVRATGTLILTATVAGYARAPGPGSLETLASASGCRNQLATCFRSHAMPCFLSKRMRKLAAAEEALAAKAPPRATENSRFW